MNTAPMILEMEAPNTSVLDILPADEPSGQLLDDHVFLIGRPPLKQFLNFMTDEAALAADVGVLTDEWRAAHDHVRRLEKEEATWADHPKIEALPKHLLPLRAEFLKDPLVQNGFNTVPTDIGIVELDRMVVYQKHINLEYTRLLKKKVGTAPTDEEIFRMCLPYDHPKPVVKWIRTHHDTYSFYSPSNDLRFLGPMFLQAQHLTGYTPPGTLAGVVGLAVGFGTNFLNAVCAENRLILNNGSHRAFVLRELGITHVPCVIQYVSTREELRVVASSDLKRNPDLYLRHPRPSVLKDYFDPKLRKIVPVPRQLRQVSVRFEVDTADLPAF